jgi:trans-aconitate methyltransferase
MPQLIQQWNPADYALHSQGQERWARELLGLLNLQPSESVLDVGCGDGRMTFEIAKRARWVVGIDSSQEMVAFASRNFPESKFHKLSFQTADAAALPFRDEFDVVYSSAVLHWVQNHESALAGIARSLHSGGRCLLQMGGKGNSPEVIDAFEATGARPRGFTYAFHSADEYRPKLKKAGLTADSVELIPKDMVHSNRAAFIGWLRTAWLPYHRHVPDSQRDQFLEAVTDRFVAAHPPDTNGAFHVRVVRLQVSAHKSRA